MYFNKFNSVKPLFPTQITWIGQKCRSNFTSRTFIQGVPPNMRQLKGRL